MACVNRQVSFESVESMKNKVIDLVKVKANLDRIKKVLQENPSVAERTRDFLSGTMPGIELEDNDMARSKPMRQVGMRIPVTIMEKAKELAERMESVEAFGGMVISTSSVLRMAMQKGIEVLDAEFPAAKSKVKRKKKKGK